MADQLSFLNTDSAEVNAQSPKATPSLAKVRSIHLTNFQIFKDFYVEFSEFDVLVGKNNSGKTSILEAVKLAHHFLRETTSIDRSGQVRFKSRAFADFPFYALPSPDEFFHRHTVNKPAQITITYGNGLTITFSVTMRYGAYNLRVANKDASAINPEDIKSILAQPPAYVPAFSGIAVAEPLITRALRENLEGQNRYTEILRNLMLAINEDSPDRFKKLQDILIKHFGAADINVEFDPSTDPYLDTYYQEGKIYYDIFMAGTGFLQIMQILTYAYRQDSATILIDEPDAHLHTSLQHRIVGLLQDIAVQEGFQVILASHSRDVIMSVGLDSILSLSLDPHRAIRLNTQQELSNLLMDLGVTDAIAIETIAHDRRILFVEGDEEKLFSIWANTLSIAAIDPPHQVQVISVRGEGNFGHVDVDVLTRVVGSPVSMLVVRDRDYRTDDMVDQLEAAENERGCCTYVLRKKEVENYLLVPSALQRLIQEKADQSGKPGLSIELVTAILTEACDSKRTFVEDRVASCIQTNSYRASQRIELPAAMQRARDYVESRWGSLEGKLTVCPGSDVLTQFRKVVQQKTGISFSNWDLARRMSPQEIDPEMVTLLKRIAAL